MKSIFRSFIWLVIPVISLSLLIGCGKGERSLEEVVATVSGKNITYGEISVDKAIVIVKDGETLTEGQISEEAFKAELKNLNVLLKEYVVSTKIAELGIVVTDKEVEDNFNGEVLLAGLTDEGVSNIKKRKTLIYDALVDYATNPDKADLIYTNKLASVFAKNEWQVYISVYDAKQDLSRFKPEANLAGSLEEMKKNMSEAIRNKIVNYKLQTAIFPDISITDESVKEFYDQTVKGREVKPEFDSVKAAIPPFLMEMYFFEQCRTCINDWIAKEIQSDRVVINDLELKGFVKAK